VGRLTTAGAASLGLLRLYVQGQPTMKRWVAVDGPEDAGVRGGAAAAGVTAVLRADVGGAGGARRGSAACACERR